MILLMLLSKIHYHVYRNQNSYADCIWKQFPLLIYEAPSYGHVYAKF